MEDFSQYGTLAEDKQQARQDNDFSHYGTPIGEPQSNRQQALSNLVGAMGSNPDMVAKTVKAAKQTGVAQPTVEQDPDTYMQLAKLGVDRATLDASPKLQSFLAAHPINAKVSQNDLHNLSGIERTFSESAIQSAGSQLGHSALAGMHDLAGAGAKLLDALNPFTLSDSDAAVLYKNDPAKLQAMHDQSVTMGLSRFARGQTADSEQNMKEVSLGAQARYGDLKYATTDTGEAAYLSPVKVVSDALRSLPTTAALALTTYLTRGASMQAEKAALAEGASAEVAKQAAITAAGNMASKFGAASEGSIGYAQQALQTQQQVEQMSHKDLAASPEYQQLVAKGYDPDAARMFLAARSGEQSGIGAGFADAITAAVGGKFLGKIIGEGGGVVSRTAKGAATESSQEFVQSGGEQVAQNMAVQANANPNQDLSDGVLESMLQGFFVGGLSGGATTGFLGRQEQKQAKAEQAVQDFNTLQTASEHAKASQTRDLAPDDFKQFVNSVTEDGHLANVYVNGEVFAQSMRAAGIGMEELQKTMPEVASQLQEAIQTQGDVNISTADYLTHIAAGKLGDTLLQHLKVEPDGMTKAEADTQQQTQAQDMADEAGKEIKEISERAAFEQSKKAVYDQILAQHNEAGRFSPEANKVNAKIYSEMIGTLAQDHGITPEEFHAQHGQTLVDDAVQGNQFEQSAKPTLDDLRSQLDQAGVTHSLSEKGGVITLSRIEVPEAERNTGKGTDAMQKLVDYADQTGQHITLTPSSDFGGNKKRLTAFYKRFGFVENKGKNRAFSTSESMYRQAQGKVLHQSGDGPFGPMFTEHYHDSQGAIEKLKQAQTGEAIGALHHPDIGDIDLVWGKEGTGASDGYGLAKLVKYHPEVLADLQGVLSAMKVTTRSANRVNLESADHKAGVRLTWDNQAKHWLMTAFKKEGGGGDVTRTDTDTISGKDDTASLTDASDGIVDQTIQNFQQTARGFFAPDSRTIGLLKDADLSTYIHETGHWALDTYAKIASQPDAPVKIKEDMGKLLNWFGIKDDEASPRGVNAEAYETIQKQLNNLDASGKLDTPEWDRLIAEARTLRGKGGIDSGIGVSALDKWNALSFDEQRPYHEQLARGFEAYFMEGKAPSLELQPVFSRIKSWMMNIYKTLRGLNVELTPEVRSVFDRMLASEDAIKEAEAARGYFMPETKPAGVSDTAWQELRDLHNAATSEATDEMQARSLRDMKWGSNAKSKMIRKLQREADAQRAVIREAVEKEVAAMPIYRAETWLRKGETTTLDGEVIKLEADAVKGAKFNKEDIAQMYPETMNARPNLDALKGMVSPSGMSPDMIADVFGFSSGDALVRDLLEMEPRESVIEGKTDQRMLEEHGDLIDARAIEQAASEAIHNPMRAKFMATWLKVITGSPISARTIQKGAKEAADAAVAAKMVRNLKPKQYEAAEAKANREALKLVATDPAGAVRAQRSAVLNNALVKSTNEALTDVQKAREYQASFDKPPKRKATAGSYLDQIDMLRGKFNFGNESFNSATVGEGVDSRVAFRTFVKSRMAVGEVPYLSESLLSPKELRKYLAEINSRDEDGNLVVTDDDERLLLLADGIERSEQKSYQDMTVGEIRGLMDTIKSLETQARNSRKILTAQGEQDYAIIRDTIATSINAHATKSGKDTRTATDWLGKKWQGLKGFGAAHIKVATWARIMDGGKDNGPVWNYIVRPANDAANFETTRRADATEKLDAILRPILKDVPLSDKAGKGKFFPSLNTSLNWGERFTLALNYGNESNLQRLLGGGIAGKIKAMDVSAIQPVLQSLSEKEWHAVQAVWDHLESYRPEIGALEKETTGVEPEWIEARSFSVRTSDGKGLNLRGGYYGIKFDPRGSLKAQQHNEAETAKDLMRAAYSADTTRRSFVKSRVEEVHGRPLLLDMQGLYSGVNDVIHDLAWRKWVMDANKLMRSKSIDAAIREHYGPEVKHELEKWRTDIVVGQRQLDDKLEKMAAYLRQGISSAGLAFNVTSAAMQPLGLTQSIVRLGGFKEGSKWVGKGLAKYIASPIQSTRDVTAESEWMANRSRTRFRELNEVSNQVKGQTAMKEWLVRYSYWLMLRTQQAVDVVTYLAAKEKFSIEHPLDDKLSTDLAVQVVKDSQGGGEEVDQSGIERTNATGKLFTVFYSFMNTGLNLGYMSKATPGSKAKFAVDMLLLVTVPALLGEMLKHSFTPGDPDDDTPILEWLLTSQLYYLLGFSPATRELTAAAKALTGGHGAQIDYGGPSGLRVFADMAKAGQQANQGEFDDGFRKAFINVTGDLTGLPSAQVNRTITGAEAINDGKTSNPAALVFGYEGPR